MDFIEKFREYGEEEDLIKQRKIIECMYKNIKKIYPYNDFVVMYHYILNDSDIHKLLNDLLVFHEVNKNDTSSKFLYEYKNFILTKKSYTLPLVYEYFDGKGCFWEYKDFIDWCIDRYWSSEDKWTEDILIKTVEEIENK